MECKDFPVTNAQAANVVLIETYWNVKTDVPSVLPDAARVLIETYWNVKTDDNMMGELSEVRINRNILECKGDFSIAHFYPPVCINRNILECKDHNVFYALVERIVLIETYWNVK